MTNHNDLHLVKLIDILATSQQYGGAGMADNYNSPIMKLRAEIVNEIHDPTTKEEYKQVAGEAIKTIGELQGKRN